jgi:nitrite reductase/ring-hydroxylating ferredoxin subunit
MNDSDDQRRGPTAPFERLIEISALPSNGRHRLQHGEFDLLICAVAGRFYVLHNRCSHQHEPLHEGRIRDGCIYCPFHGARFDLATGMARSAPATAPLRVFPCQVNDGFLEAMFE